MPRRRAWIVLCLTGLLLAFVPACGSGTGGAEEASDYLYSCALQVTNGTSSELVQTEWVLVERRSSGDVVWGALGRTPGESWGPGKELTVILGPNYAEPFNPSLLEWEVVFVDASDVRYGPWTVPITECGSTTFTVTPEDAS